jgi:hypothetical protein
MELSDENLIGVQLAINMIKTKMALSDMYPYDVFTCQALIEQLESFIRMKGY